jgi:uroporphyrinogen-III synthase
MEKGERAVTPALAKKAVTRLRATPELLPVVPDTRHNDDRLAADLGALRYSGYAYLRGQSRNSAEVLFDALDRRDLGARLVEASEPST